MSRTYVDLIYMFLHVFEYGLKYPPFPFMFWILLDTQVLSDLVICCQLSAVKRWVPFEQFKQKRFPASFVLDI